MAGHEREDRGDLVRSLLFLPVLRTVVPAMSQRIFLGQRVDSVRAMPPRLLPRRRPVRVPRRGARILRGALRLLAAAVITTGGTIVFAVTLQGAQLYTVLSGSMEPAISTGSVVVVAPAQGNRAPYQSGDVITFRAAGGGAPVTHRVLGVRHDAGRVRYRTKGDANPSPDAQEVLQQSVVGKTLVSVPFLGYVLVAMRTPIGFLFLILLPATLVILHELNVMRGAWKELRPSRFASAGVFGAVALAAGVAMTTSGLFSDTVVMRSTTIAVKETPPAPAARRAEPSPSQTPTPTASPCAFGDGGCDQTQTTHDDDHEHR
ncbi:MAG: signal peptidase, endoplasmic reticulum-type [Parcubacteria group bacterium Gr01-1014_38]|nr:MAG: signal peptidase, endoplasmic reticulum-type [Parcubacteria group bacterium Gr01-1014_38]